MTVPAYILRALLPKAKGVKTKRGAIRIVLRNAPKSSFKRGGKL